MKIKEIKKNNNAILRENDVDDASKIEQIKNPRITFDLEVSKKFFNVDKDLDVQCENGIFYIKSNKTDEIFVKDKRDLNMVVRGDRVNIMANDISCVISEIKLYDPSNNYIWSQDNMSDLYDDIGIPSQGISFLLKKGGVPYAISYLFMQALQQGISLEIEGSQIDELYEDTIHLTNDNYKHDWIVKLPAFEITLKLDKNYLDDTFIQRINNSLDRYNFYIN